MASYKNIAVIGAGPVGLVALKSLLEEGHDVTVYEQQASIGGLWNYQEESGKNYVPMPADSRQYLSGCYHSLVQNTSRLMTQFSDFPASDLMPTVMKHSDYYRYLQDYAENFGLKDHVKLNSTVTRLLHAASSEAAARSIRQWEVHYEREGRNEMEVYDLVVVASGKMPRPLVPTYPGQDIFENTMIHSAQVRRDELFENKRVLIAGGGFSGAEMIRNALNGKAKNIYWTVSSSTKNTDHNHWMFGRIPDDSQPNKSWDQYITRQGQPQEVFGDNGIFSTWLYPLNQCEVNPSPRFPGDGYAITDTSLVKQGIQSKQVQFVASISRLTETSVTLSDGSELEDIDVLVFCTGYTRAFPFLDSFWDEKKQEQATFYRHMLPTEKQLQGIAFAGMTFSLPSFLPVAEMQTRWLARFWASRTIINRSMYSNQELCEFEREIQCRKESLLHREKFTFLFDPFEYIEKLAAELGCRPPVEELEVSDKELGFALLNAPFISAQYRLVGENAWPKAREYIIKVAKETRDKNIVQ